MVFTRAAALPTAAHLTKSKGRIDSMLCTMKRRRASSPWTCMLSRGRSRKRGRRAFGSASGGSTAILYSDSAQAVRLPGSAAALAGAGLANHSIERAPTKTNNSNSYVSSAFSKNSLSSFLHFCVFVSEFMNHWYTYAHPKVPNSQPTVCCV